MPPSPSIKAIVRSIDRVGDRYIIAQIEADAAFQYRAGQYCFVFFDDHDGSFSRPYSIASAPGSASEVCRLEFCWLTSGDPRTAAALTSLKIGDAIHISAAGGRFEQPKRHRRSVFVAGGSGISPLRSLLYADLDQGPSAERVLLYGCEDAQAVPFQQEFHSLASQHPLLHYQLYLSQGAGNVPQAKPGYPTDDLADFFGADTDYFLCGPPAMMETARRELERLGAASGQIFQDRY